MHDAADAATGIQSADVAGAGNRSTDAGTDAVRTTAVASTTPVVYALYFVKKSPFCYCLLSASFRNFRWAHTTENLQQEDL